MKASFRDLLFASSAVSIALSGCATKSERTCRDWQDAGAMVSSLDSCVRCAENLGTGNPDAVRGCALGMDAAALISPNRSEMRARPSY